MLSFICILRYFIHSILAPTAWFVKLKIGPNNGPLAGITTLKALNYLEAGLSFVAGGGTLHPVA
jgi:hypothetical protein